MPNPSAPALPNAEPRRQAKDTPILTRSRKGIPIIIQSVAGLTLLYWRLGKRIQTEDLKSDRAEYAKQVVYSLAAKLGWTHFNAILPLKDDLRRDF